MRKSRASLPADPAQPAGTFRPGYSYPFHHRPYRVWHTDRNGEYLQQMFAVFSLHADVRWACNHEMCVSGSLNRVVSSVAGGLETVSGPTPQLEGLPATRRRSGGGVGLSKSLQQGLAVNTGTFNCPSQSPWSIVALYNKPNGYTSSCTFETICSVFAMLVMQNLILS